MEKVIIKPETKFRKFVRKFSQWQNSGWDPTKGNQYEKKIRKANFEDNWILKNIDQEEVKKIGTAFGNSCAEPLNRNTVISNIITTEELDAAKTIIGNERQNNKFKSAFYYLNNKKKHSEKQTHKDDQLDSIPIIWNMPSHYKGNISYDMNGNPHGPYKNGDTVYLEYYRNGVFIDSIRHLK